MGKYVHISKNNTRRCLCGVVTDRCVFGIWGRADCPRCQAIAIAHPENVVRRDADKPNTSEMIRGLFDAMKKLKEEKSNGK